MAVIFGAIGGAVLVGAIASVDPYSEYSDYHYDYSDYDDYHDAEVRRQRRIARLKEDAQYAINNLEEEKKEEINPQLYSEKLKKKSARTVSLDAMDKDVRKGLNQECKDEVKENVSEELQELECINQLLAKIEEMEKGQ